MCNPRSLHQITGFYISPCIFRPAAHRNNNSYGCSSPDTLPLLLPLLLFFLHPLPRLPKKNPRLSIALKFISTDKPFLHSAHPHDTAPIPIYNVIIMFRYLDYDALHSHIWRLWLSLWSQVKVICLHGTYTHTHTHNIAKCDASAHSLIPNTYLALADLS